MTNIQEVTRREVEQGIKGQIDNHINNFPEDSREGIQRRQDYQKATSLAVSVIGLYQIPCRRAIRRFQDYRKATSFAISVMGLYQIPCRRPIANTDILTFSSSLSALSMGNSWSTEVSSSCMKGIINDKQDAKVSRNWTFISVIMVMARFTWCNGSYIYISFWYVNHFLQLFVDAFGIFPLFFNLHEISGIVQPQTNV